MAEGTVIRVRRSRWRGVLAVLVLTPWGAGLLLAAVTIGLDAVLGGFSPRDLAIAAIPGALSIVTVPVQVQAVRMLLSRPRVTLEADALVVHDPVLLRRDSRIGRDVVARAEGLRWKDPAVWYDPEYDVTELSPFREPLNLQIVLSDDHIFASARRGGGLWLWRMSRKTDRAARFPEPGDRYRRLRLRVAGPDTAVTAIAEWAAARGAGPMSAGPAAGIRN
jgi:hypothetical protein